MLKQNPSFRQFFGQKGCQMLSDLNSEARFGNLSSFRIFRPHLIWYTHFDFFTSHAFSKKIKSRARSKNFKKDIEREILDVLPLKSAKNPTTLLSSRLTPFFGFCRKCTLSPPNILHFGSLNTMRSSEKRNSKKIGGAPLPKFFENALEAKNSKCENHVKWEPIICKMRRGFQIWPQNSNRTTFDLLLTKKKL